MSQSVSRERGRWGGAGWGPIEELEGVGVRGLSEAVRFDDSVVLLQRDEGRHNAGGAVLSVHRAFDSLLVESLALRFDNGEISRATSLEHS
jgi:hypothetical protein